MLFCDVSSKHMPRNSIDKSLDAVLGSSHVCWSNWIFFFNLFMRKPLKKMRLRFQKKKPNLKGISFPLSSTQQWYHASNSTTIYLVEWKITTAILVVNNLFSHSRDPLQGQHLLSNFMIRLIKTVLLKFFFLMKPMLSTDFFLFFLAESACFSWSVYMFLQWTWKSKVGTSDPSPPHPSSGPFLCIV